MPVLVIHGEHDPWVPTAEVEAMTAALSDAQLVVIPDAWHTFSVTHPEATVAALEPFLERITAAG
jgi:pimeloyl-ACP methyl ester carboxylesterase